MDQATLSEHAKKILEDANAPKSLREALERIAQYGTKDSFVAHRYAVNEKRSPIGLFFTQEQLDYLANHSAPEGGEPLISSPIKQVAEVVGESNIEAMCGMSIDQASALQALLEKSDTSSVLVEVTEVLEGKKTHMEGVEFAL